MLTTARKLSYVTLAVGIAITALSAASAAPKAPAKAGAVRLEGRLSSTKAEPLASGKAKFEKRGDRVTFSTEVEDLVNADAIDVVVGGTSVGSVGVVNGAADLNLSGASVPDMTAGTTVQVFDSDTGALILVGSLSAN